MKEKTKAFYKTVFKYWCKEKLKPFLIKTLIVLYLGYGLQKDRISN